MTRGLNFDQHRLEQLIRLRLLEREPPVRILLHVATELCLRGIPEGAEVAAPSLLHVDEVEDVDASFLDVLQQIVSIRLVGDGEENRVTFLHCVRDVPTSTSRSTHSCWNAVRRLVLKS
jgi:hypothetical protein